MYGLLDDRITYYTSRISCVEIGCVREVYIIAAKQLLVSGNCQLTLSRLFNWYGLLLLDVISSDVSTQLVVKLLCARHKREKWTIAGQQGSQHCRGKTHNWPDRVGPVEIEEELKAEHWVDFARDTHCWA